MLNQQTTDQLRALKLTGMLEAWEQQREQPQTHDLSFDERLALLVEREVLHRENRRLARLLKAAKLRVNACVEDIDYRHPRGLKRVFDLVKDFGTSESPKSTRSSTAHLVPRPSWSAGVPPQHRKLVAATHRLPI